MPDKKFRSLQPHLLAGECDKQNCPFRFDGLQCLGDSQENGNTARIVIGSVKYGIAGATQMVQMRSQYNNLISKTAAFLKGHHVHRLDGVGMRFGQMNCGLDIRPCQFELLVV